MAKWNIMHTARVMKDVDTGELGIKCGCGEDIVPIGNMWRDVTDDFTWDERVIPLYYAVMAGNKVLQLIADIQLSEEVSEEIHLFDTTKWRSMVDSKFPIMVASASSNGVVTIIDGQHWPDGYVTADLTGVSTSDHLYINIFVPVE